MKEFSLLTSEEDFRDSGGAASIKTDTWSTGL